MKYLAGSTLLIVFLGAVIVALTLSEDEHHLVKKTANES